MSGFVRTRPVLTYDQRNLRCHTPNSWDYMLSWHQGSRALAGPLRGPQRAVSPAMALRNKHTDCPLRLCLVVIIALPVATPAEYKNSASYALGDFTNRESQ